MLQNAIQSALPYFHTSESQTASAKSVTFDEAGPLPSFINPVSRLEFLGKVQYTFNVSHRFVDQFALIKGLIDFHRPKDIQFRFNREEKSIQVRAHLHHVDFLVLFLHKVEEWLVSEVQFKMALKKIIQFEARYKSQRSAIYNSLLGIPG